VSRLVVVVESEQWLPPVTSSELPDVRVPVGAIVSLETHDVLPVASGIILENVPVGMDHGLSQGGAHSRFLRVAFSTSISDLSSRFSISRGLGAVSNTAELTVGKAFVKTDLMARASSQCSY
jgi:hypothetical protein